MSPSSDNRSESLLNRLVGTVVSPVIDSVDVGRIVERVDVNDVVGRVDLDDTLDRIDVDRLLDRIDVDRLLDRIDVDRLLDRVDMDRLLDRMDMNGLVDRFDVDRLLDRMNVNGVLDRVDIDRFLDRIDVDGLLDRVDIDRFLDRLDVDGLIRRVDLVAVIDRVDLDRVLERVDVNALIERTEIGSIIARSTTGVFGELVDAARTAVMAVDQVVQAIPARLLGRAPGELPGLPGADSLPPAVPDDAPGPVANQGRYAGSVSRFLAFIVDQFVIGALFALGVLLGSTAFTVVVGADVGLSENRVLIAVAYACWALVYVAGSLAATGQTIGKALLGVRVVDANGDDMPAGAALLRTVLFPISFLLFGVGLLVGLARADRRELHDLLAGTAVVYAWDAVIAERRAGAAQDTALPQLG